MKVIPPLTITDAMLASSTAIETAPAAYVAGTTYANGAQVSVAGSLGALDCYVSLQSSNVGHTPATSPTFWAYAGTTYAPYSPGTTYADGQRAIDTTNHLVYESLIGSNSNNPLTDETKWSPISNTNRWAMFDVLRSTATIGASPMVVALTPGVRVDAGRRIDRLHVHAESQHPHSPERLRLLL
jgi:hypothetical protein